MAVIDLPPRTIRGVVEVPPSKSIAHRALILSFLTGGGAVTPIIPSQDMLATQDCLAGLAGSARYPCRESGSTLRFMIPLALLKTEGGLFTGCGRLGQRPLTPYEAVLGADFAYEEREPCLRLRVSGALRPGAYTLPGNVSSQFITGLLLALPFAPGDSELHITPPLESAGYIELTLQALADFGLRVERPDALTFLIPGSQQGRRRDYTVEGDYSQGAVHLCAGALGHSVAVRGLRRDSRQGDAQILPWLREMGAETTWASDTVTAAAPRGLHGITLDGGQCPDIMPLMALVCALARGESRLNNLARLRLKECDRLEATCRELARLGAHIRIENEGLVIQGRPLLTGGVTVSSHNDHRMAMMLALASTRCQSPIRLDGPEAVAKSWPDFWDYQGLSPWTPVPEGTGRINPC